MTAPQKQQLERIQARIDKHHHDWEHATNRPACVLAHARWCRALDDLQAFYDKIQ